MEEDIHTHLQPLLRRTIHGKETTFKGDAEEVSYDENRPHLRRDVGTDIASLLPLLKNTANDTHQRLTTMLKGTFGAVRSHRMHEQVGQHTAIRIKRLTNAIEHSVDTLHGWRGGRGTLPHSLLNAGVQNGNEHPLLVLEVVEEGALSYVGSVSDGLNRRRLKTVLTEKLICRLDKTATGLLFTLLASGLSANG